MRIASATVVVGLLACGGARPPGPGKNDLGNHPASGGSPDAGSGIPDDVVGFIERWQTCQHWSGEEPYDAERAEEIRDRVEESCPGNNERLQQLKLRYSGRADVLTRLGDLE